MKHSLYDTDLYRYYGKDGAPLLKRVLRPLEIRYLSVFRKAQAAESRFGKAFYMLRLYRLSQKTQIQIPAATRIGKGLYIGHTGRLIINPQSVLGDNINLSTGVTIGIENRGKRKGCPTIGNNCWIGSNAVIVGNIHIGNDVLIAPLAFVNFDVPDHSIVLGNPGRILHRDHATEGYIENTV